MTKAELDALKGIPPEAPAAPPAPAVGMGDLKKVESEQPAPPAAESQMVFHKNLPSTTEIDPLTGNAYIRNNDSWEKDPFNIGAGAPRVDIPLPKGLGEKKTEIPAAAATPATTPAVEFIPPPAVKPVAPVAMGEPAAVEPAITAASPEPVVEEKPKEDFGAKLKALAKKTGMSILELLQAGAYGWAGVDKPLAIDTRIGQEREDKAAADAKAERESSVLEERTYTERQKEIERAFQQQLQEAQNAWAAQQSELGRAGDVNLAGVRAAQANAAGAPVSKEDALARMSAEIAKAYGGR